MPDNRNAKGPTSPERRRFLELSAKYGFTAAVAAGAREHHHAAPPRVALEEALARELREGAAGVLHHLDEENPVVFDHRAVDLDHLLGRQERNIRGADLGERPHSAFLPGDRRAGPRPRRSALTPPRGDTRGDSVPSGGGCRRTR